jgi:hypothetical protein
MEKEIVKRSAEMVRKAAMNAAEEVLKDQSKDLTGLLANHLPTLAATALGSFSVQFVVLCLRAIADEEKSKLILQQVNRLVEAPLKTGLEELRTALALEKYFDQESEDQTSHRISRYRDSLRKLDEALVLAKDDQEKAAVHLFRALASARIPGAEIEARLHASAFVSTCETLANRLIVEATAQEQKAKKNEERAANIVDQGRSRRLEYSSRLNKRTLENTALTQRQSASALRREADSLRESSAVISALVG